MTMTLRAAGAALICVAMTGQAWAAGSCLKQADLTALRASALQQQLMVAAFTCHDSESYNRFVLAYRGELQASDAALMAFFQHRNPATGTADYHTFKTKLANVAAIRSSTDTTAFCAHANAAYNVALGTKTPLATLVSSLASASKTAFNTCPDAAPKTIIQAQGPAELPKAAANLPPIAAPTTSVAVATLVKSAPPAAKAPKAAAEKPAGPLVLAKAAAPKAASKVPQQPLELDDPLPHPDRIVVAQADIASAEDTMAPLAAAEPEQALNDRAVQDLAMDEDVMTIAPQTPTRAQVAQPAARPPYRDRYAQAQPRRENTYDGGRYENSDDDAEQALCCAAALSNPRACLSRRALRAALCRSAPAAALSANALC